MERTLYAPQRRQRVGRCFGTGLASQRAGDADNGWSQTRRYGQNDLAMALGRKNWLFAGSLRSGQRAANVMSLIQSAKINDLDPQAYLRDVLERLPSTRYSDIDSLLPHNWSPAIKVG